MSKSLKDLLNKSKSKEPISLKLNTPQKEPHKRGLLFGTGLTARKAERAGKQQEKLQQESFKLSDDNKEEFGELVNLNLPDSLMDDGIVLDEYQSAAVNGLEFEKYGCLIGQAGVGKTTTAKALINRLIKTIPIVDLNKARVENQRSNESIPNAAVCIVSFMGKAVQQIKRALPVEYHPLCGTIHSTLGYAPEFETRIDEETGENREVKVFRPTFTALNKLPFKLCVIDEGGSVPINLFNELVAALPSDCRIIIMGDLNQLPPVTGRSVLGFAITEWPTFVLSKIHRQKGGDANPIIENADRIIKGMKPLSDSKKFLIKQVPDSAFEAFQHTMATVQTLHKKGIFDPLTDAFIVPQNVETLGQEAFNEKLVNYFNPVKKIDNVPVNPRIIITAGWKHATFAVGDKIMATANDRDLGITNGMIGVVKEIIPNLKFKGDAIADQVTLGSDADLGSFTMDLTNLHDEIKEAEKEEADEEDAKERAASHTMVVKYQNMDDVVRYSSAGSFGRVKHSYAITCHKSQGSEYPTVIVLVHSSNLGMLNREWLYTAITRAKERVIILTNHRGMTHAVNRQQIKGKTIEEKAKRFIALSKGGDAELPELGEPVKV